MEMLSQEVEPPPPLLLLEPAPTLLLEDRFILTGGWELLLLLAGSTASIRWAAESGEQALAFSRMDSRHLTTQSRVGAW